MPDKARAAQIRRIINMLLLYWNNHPEDSLGEVIWRLGLGFERINSLHWPDAEVESTLEKCCARLGTVFLKE